MSRYPGTAAVVDRPGAPGQRAPIALSWRRSSLCGVDPAVRLDDLARHEVDPDTPLLVATRPVLEQLVGDLAGLSLAVLLAGRDGVVLDVRSDVSHGPLAEMARSRIGRRCTEDQVGTNSIGTVLEVESRMHITGPEHYLESLRSLDCVGAPIRHPVTGRTEGVLTICGGTAGATAALGPLLSYATRDIEHRWRSWSPKDHLRLLKAFQSAARRHPQVIVLAADLVLATPGVAGVLGQSDQDLLRQRGAQLGPGEVLRDEATQLTSGKVVGVTVRRCGDDRGDGVLVEIRSPGPAPRVRIPRGPNAKFSAKQVVAGELDRARRGRRRTLVTGESGTGRSSAMRQLAGDARLVTLDCEGAERDGPYWEYRLDQVLGAASRGGHPGTLVVLDRIELLSAQMSLRALDRIADSAAWVALIAPPPETLSGEHAALVACCECAIHLQPLRARTAELTTLVRDFAGPEARRALRWTPDALAALRTHSWPGNLHELRAVVRHVARTAVDGCVAVETLPDSVGRSAGRPLNPLQRSEREVISTTLQACNGNKVHASAHLGISRTTLYRRMRELGIPSG
jgi:transcriptional regulator of acetoin/glycerol metabolism